MNTEHDARSTAGELAAVSAERVITLRDQGDHGRMLPTTDLGRRIWSTRHHPTGIPAAALRYLRGGRIDFRRVLIGPDCEVSGSGSWHVEGKLNIGVIGMPFSAVGDRTVFRNDGQVIVSGHVHINRGARIAVDKGAELRIGRKTFLNCFSLVHATSSISIGRDCAISWRCEILDSQYHELSYHGRCHERRSVVVGDHVWIGAGTRVLAGSEIGDGCVVAAGSIVNGTFPPHSLLGGSPARVLRSNVDWTL